MQIDKDLAHRLSLLEEKYNTIGQDMKSYLDGLLYSNPLTYWDYIQLDTLLTLQHPRTDFPDELIFIVYHQITELYFKLVRHELEQLSNNGKWINHNGEDKGWHSHLDPQLFAERLQRVNAYFEALTKSFDIMTLGMEKEQFLRYRMALLPASGFQAVNYRKIEIMCTDFINLVDKDHRARFQSDSPIEEMFEHTYWKRGATEMENGAKTLTLKHFERKYSDELLEMASAWKTKNMWAKYKQLGRDQQGRADVINALKMLDVNVNINWPLVHYKTAARYLQRDSAEVAATGGTNWQKYLPPRFQKRIFFPELWTEAEKEEWGKSWVEKEVIMK